MQSQSQQNRDLSRDADLQPQQDIDIIKVDIPEVPDLHIVEVVIDPTTANKADDLTNSDSNSEIRMRVAYLKRKKEKARLRAKLKHLEHKMARGFIDERHQINNNKHTCQLSLERSKHVRDPNIYLVLLQRKLTVFFTQVNNVFRQKPITYFTKIDKVLFAVNYLASIIRNK